MNPTPAGADAAWSEERGLSPELRALLACARAVVTPASAGELRRALSRCPDNDRLCRDALAHGMLGQLHRLVTQEAPAVPSGPAAADPDLVVRLRDLQRLAIERSLRQTGYLLRVLNGLGEGGVQVIPYKGPAWAEQLYGDVALRTWADLDLLVPYHQATAVRGTLLAGGFSDGNDFNPRVLDQRRRGWGEMHFVSPQTGMEMDVHWEVTVGFSGRSIAAEDLVARARPSTLLGRPVLRLSDEDMLLACAIHGSRHRWCTVELLLGLGVLIATTPVPWADILTAARAAGCRRRVTVSVVHACRVLGIPRPPAVLDCLAHDHLGRLLLRSLGPGTLDHDGAAGPRRELEVMLWTFAGEDSMPAGLWHGLTRLLRPGPADWAVIALPRGLSWLYWFLRPVRLTGKWGRCLMRR